MVKQRGIPVIKKLETCMSKQGTFDSNNELIVKLSCIVIILMSIFIILPTPFLNSIPAIVILMLGIGLVNFNFKLLVFALFAGTATATLLVFLISTALGKGTF